MEKNGEKIRDSRGQRAETTPLFPKNYPQLRKKKNTFRRVFDPEKGLAQNKALNLRRKEIYYTQIIS